MTIYDIAEKCGVSIATVSRVLNNSAGVRPQTRQKVLEVMAAEHFVPNSLARGLSTGSSGAVGILCADLQDPFHAALVSCLEEKLRLAERTTVLRCTGAQAEARREALAYMQRQNVSALLLVGTAGQEDVADEAIAAVARQMPVIVLDGALSQPGVYSITADEKAAMEELIDRLVRVHKPRVLLLCDQDSYSCRQKQAGYRAGHERHGLPLEEARIVTVGREPEEVNACIKRLLVQGVTFDAVIASEDIVALGARKALQRIGLNMPIVGCHDSVMARCCTPELTSIDTAPEAMCEAALDTLAALLSGQEAPAHVQLPCHITERESFRI